MAIEDVDRQVWVRRREFLDKLVLERRVYAIPEATSPAGYFGEVGLAGLPRRPGRELGRDGVGQ